MIYEPDPQPRDRRQHNEWMNAAVTKYRVPLQMVCPDCYEPPRMCRHLQELMHVGYLKAKK